MAFAIRDIKKVIARSEKAREKAKQENPLELRMTFMMRSFFFLPN